MKVHALRALRLHWCSFPLIAMGEPVFKKINYKNAKKKKKKSTLCLKCRETVVGNTSPSDESQRTTKVAYIPYSEMSRNCTCSIPFSLIKSFLIHGKLADAYCAPPVWPEKL